MGEKLPLIPEKGSLCADVCPIILSVFRELDYLPPLTTELPAPLACTYLEHTLGAQPDNWIEKYKAECEEMRRREGELKQEQGRRVSRVAARNLYQLRAPRPLPSPPRWRLAAALLCRRDLVPDLHQDAGRDDSLWVKNILNHSSCAVSAAGDTPPLPPPPPQRLPTWRDGEATLQTLSIGAVEPRVPPLAPPPPPAPPQPEYIICVPPELNFINFSVGHLHTQSIRLVNVSKFEVRLSLRPPERMELDVEIHGPRGLTVTSGAAAELLVHFRPADVRAVHDTLLIRVSLGRHFLVPIACYMEPPILDILVPSVTASALWCSPAEAGECHARAGCDVLELGSRLLGDVHCVRLLLHCLAEHASFFLLTEDSWLSYTLDCVSARGVVVSGPFVVSPAWWRGGGGVRGGAWCRARVPGVHCAALRVLSSTATVRHLHVLADSLLFTPEHITIIAQEKDYDICSDGEPACEYYVQLGTAFPRRSLGASVQLVNRSPVVYSYYWSVRPWSLCSCWEEDRGSDFSVGSEASSERLCPGAKEARAIDHDEPERYASREENARLVRVEPARGMLLPRSSCSVHVHVPDVGARLGVQRAVLMLVLTDIPKQALPPNYDAMIVTVKEETTESIPGVESETREVCELVCGQMEVWWDVAPVRFVLDPPVLSLQHSRRVSSVMVNIHATQLFGCEGAQVSWRVPEGVRPSSPLALAPAHTCSTPLQYPLPSLPNEFPETNVITLVAAGQEWTSQCTVSRHCATRHPALRPARAWLGVVAPGTHMEINFQLCNDTHQHIYWWAEAFRWWRENEPSAACRGRRPCAQCRELACSCDLLRPARGALPHARRATICYNVNAPECDGCVATLVRARRTEGDVCAVPGGAGSAARAVLVAYRVLAPRLVLRLLPCARSATHHDAGCGCRLDGGEVSGEEGGEEGGEAGGARGTATLRPQRALTLGRRTCYRLRLTNITPLPTAVHFDADSGDTEQLRAKFCPSEVRVRPYGEVEIRVVLEARRVCRRRLFVYRGRVDRAYRPLYLLVDTAIAGVKISCEVPLGGALKPDSFVVMPRMQKEEVSSASTKPTTPAEIFADEDRKRRALRESKCRCPFEMVYIPPARPLAPPRDGEEQLPLEIVWTPPPLTRVCPCEQCARPLVPEPPDPICLQFPALPLRTVRTRTIHLRNESVVTARWSTALRRWPRQHSRTLAPDQWAGDVRAPGVALQVAPSAGVLAAHARVALHVSVYADCWGLYHDQLLILIDNIEPIVLDVWIEAVGAPLQLAISAARPGERGLDVAPTVWMSASAPQRVLRARNTSRAPLLVHAYTAASYEYPQDELPFRLYIRYYDVPPRTCSCVTDFQAELAGESCDSGSYVEEVDTGFDIYLAPDCGPQTDGYYSVSPEVCTVQPGHWVDWELTLAAPQHDAERAPDVDLLLRLQPLQYAGPCWWRPEPPPQRVRLRQVERAGSLRVSCRELRVRLCALDLPYGDVLRVRKRFHVMNVGSGVLELGVETAAPWHVVLEHTVAAPDELPQRALSRGPCGAGCGCAPRESSRHRAVPLHLEPTSCVEMCVEVAVSTAHVWPAAAAASAGPCQAPVYPPRSLTTTPLHIFDDDNILKTVQLVLDLEFPILRVQPAVLDFGVVAAGDTRKMYFSVSHTSSTVTLDIATYWVGGSEFRIWPPFLRIAPGCCANVYLQYTAMWRAAPSEGCAHVFVCCGAGQALTARDAQTAQFGQTGPAVHHGHVRHTGQAANVPQAGKVPQVPEAACLALGQELARAAWCRATVLVRAAPARDHKFHLTQHDHTDDACLLPTDAILCGSPAAGRVLPPPIPFEYDD